MIAKKRKLLELKNKKTKNQTHNKKNNQNEWLMKQNAGISLGIVNVTRVIVNYSAPFLCQDRI